ncbi:MAG: GTP-binding protein, partial [Promethearchaeota archaeon]
MAEEYDYLFKSIVVGDGGVGKTALTLRFSKGFFTEDYKMTIGVDFHVKTISIDSNEGPIRAKLQIWDTGGQERFQSIRPMYYRGSLGALLIFDLTNSSSFEHLPGWIEEVRANVKTEIPLLLVGNKSDLVDQRAISLEEINKFTYDFNLYYMETSAKTGEGVGDCFYILACLMIGSGVPDQLVSKGIVFNPGQISQMAPETFITSSPQVQTEDEYSAPPVPEPFSSLNQAQKFEPEPEFDYSAPPVPEPTKIAQSNQNPPFESEFEPEIPIPEPTLEEKPKGFTEFEFKTPEDILTEEKSESRLEPRIESPQEPIVSSSEEAYVPKAAPFTSNIPVPAPVPEGFQKEQVVQASESNPSANAPFLPSSDQSASKSDSLVDYMPKPIYSKKDKKKQEKQKKKEEKERQQKLIEEMKKAKKEKKEKPKKSKKEKPEYPDTTVIQPTPKVSSSGESPRTPS